MNEPIVLIGGYGSHWAGYQHFARGLARVSGRRVFIADITHITWLVADVTDYILLVNKAHDAVEYALAKTGASKVALVGHSAGGIIARAYLADRLLKPDHTPRSGYQRVSHLITLGSPLGAVEDHRHN